MRIPSIVGIAPDAEPGWTMFSARSRIAPGIEPVFPDKDDAIGYAKFRSRSYDAVIHVYDDAGNVIETHEHNRDFKEW